eukprot:m.86914 g.86914  ORF g.86914 m.86914 type:complete len:64 (-) comp13076_c0_seq5:53-244(-)
MMFSERLHFTSIFQAVDALLDVYDTRVVYFESGKKYWLRLSAQVYLEMSDFVTLGDRMLELLQ